MVRHEPGIRTLALGGAVHDPPSGFQDARAIEDSRSKTAEALVIVNTHLGSRQYLAGSAFTTGDIALGCGLWRWMALPIERPALPNVERWFATLGQRPAYRKIVMQPLN